MNSFVRQLCSTLRAGSFGALVVLMMLAISPNQSSAQCNYGWGSLFITSPASGSQWTRNTTMTINWYPNYYSIGNYGGTYKLEYSTDGGSTWTNLATGINGYTRTYSWLIPASVTPGTNWRIRVSEVAASGWCTQSNPGISGAFTVLKGCFPATITAQPASQSICSGGSATLSVSSDMTAGTYDWFKDGVLIGTTATNAYVINPVTAASGGVYYVTLRDACNPVTAVVTSASARLTVINAPAIATNLPATKTVCESANDTLRVRATGAGLRFQWYKNGLAITGATDSNYILINANANTIGSYYCMVSGTCSPSVNSATLALDVALKPRITTDANNLDICVGTAGSVSVAATGNNLVYQWYKDGKPVSGGFASTLAFTNYDYSMDGRYQCVATSNVPNPNNCNVTAQSRIVRVAGYRAPVLKTQPKSFDACVGSQSSVVAEFTGTGLSYAWFKDGKPVANSNSNELLLPRVTAADAGRYVVVATASCGLKSTSDTVSVTVLTKPTITTQPVDASLEVGDRMELTTAGTDVRSIQWYKNDVAIPGANTSTYAIASVVKSDAGFYSARITNTCGGAISNYARVQVNDPVVPRPAIELAENSTDFGEIPVGYDKTVTLTGLIKSVGNAPLTVTALNVSPSEFSISNAPALPFDIAPGSAQTITVKAAPTVKGPLFGTLKVVSNAPMMPQASVALTAQYVLRYNHNASQEFGVLETGKSVEKCVKITNTSNQDITIDQATVIGLNASEFSVVTPLPITLAVGASADVCVKFAPGTAGKKSAQLSLRSSSGGNSTVDLTGTGEVPGDVVEATEAKISVSPNPMRDQIEIRFGKSMPAMDITIVNSNGRNVASFSHEGVDAGSSVRWNGGNGLASGSYTLVVRYSGVVTTIPLTVVK